MTEAWKESRLLRLLDRLGRRLAASADLRMREEGEGLVFEQVGLLMRVRMLLAPAHLGLLSCLAAAVLVCLRAGHHALTGQALFPGPDFLSVGADLFLFAAAPIFLVGVGTVGLRARHELRIEGSRFLYRNSQLAKRRTEPSDSEWTASGRFGQLKKLRLVRETRQVLGGASSWWVLRVDVQDLVSDLALHATESEDEARAVEARLVERLRK